MSAQAAKPVPSGPENYELARTAAEIDEMLRRCLYFRHRVPSGEVVSNTLRWALGLTELTPLPGSDKG